MFSTWRGPEAGSDALAVRRVRRRGHAFMTRVEPKLEPGDSAAPSAATRHGAAELSRGVAVSSHGARPVVEPVIVRAADAARGGTPRDRAIAPRRDV